MGHLRKTNKNAEGYTLPSQHRSVAIAESRWLENFVESADGWAAAEREDKVITERSVGA